MNMTKNQVIEKINDMIDTAIQSELSYQKDLIKNTTWDFLENKAPELTLETIFQDHYDNIEEISTLSYDDIVDYLNKTIAKYENEHGSLRMLE